MITWKRLPRSLLSTTVSGDWSRLFSRIGANSRCRNGVDVAEGGGIISNGARAGGFSPLAIPWNLGGSFSSASISTSSSRMAEEPGAKLSLLFARLAVNRLAREGASPRADLAVDRAACTL